MEDYDLRDFITDRIDDFNIFDTPFAIFQDSTRQKEQIFQINNYTFLKKKKEEVKDKASKINQWNEEEDAKLTKLMNNFPYLTWTEISNHFNNRNPTQCMHRWNKVLQPGIKKGKWSREEDEVLINWVQKHGAQKWNKLATIIKGRTSKQIRDRWINNLNPNRSNFSWNDELDKALLINYLQYGSSWVMISKHIPNSSENMVKNRFYSLLRSTVNKNIKNKSEVIKKDEIDELCNFNVKKKRNNYTLSLMLNYLPILLEEKGINVGENKPIVEEPIEKFTPEQKNMLTDFFETLTEKANVPRNKFKSAILFNLQLALLHKILDKLKLQIYHRFFAYFKTNTIKCYN
jgi:hypothetical protein